MENTNQGNETASHPEDPIQTVENNTALQSILGPLINEFRLLRESVNTIHADYADLKQTILKQKTKLKQELADKIDNNTIYLNAIARENKTLKKENDTLKTRLDRLEQNQLCNNVMIMRIKEGPYEQYSTTKL